MLSSNVLTLSNVSQIEQSQASKAGEMRFGPLVYDTDLLGLIENTNATEDQIYVYAVIKASWDVDNTKVRKSEKLTNEQVFRIATHCGFDERRIMELLHNTHRRLFELSVFDLERRLLTKALFPCPGLKTREGWDTIYMRPSRFFPKDTPTKDIIDNLIYVMNHVKLRNPNGKIAFLANMDGWTMENFSRKYCMKFMAALQGRIFPVEVSLFMIVNPPNWFGKVWNVMRPMLSAEFIKEVLLISDEVLPYIMDDNFEKFLPDEMPGGEANTDSLVKDFVSFGKTQEMIVKPSWFRKRGSKNHTMKKRKEFIRSLWWGAPKKPSSDGILGSGSDHSGTEVSSSSTNTMR
eukprot:Nitzschia sp. Nitz4//scaffold59_size112058//15378//16421//NITZ4_004099-RA/size112058-processed-gene-0.181-mRNA-1//1//CDS//3329555093//185//frame0